MNRHSLALWFALIVVSAACSSDMRTGTPWQFGGEQPPDTGVDVIDQPPPTVPECRDRIAERLPTAIPHFSFWAQSVVRAFGCPTFNLRPPIASTSTSTSTSRPAKTAVMAVLRRTPEDAPAPRRASC